MCRMSMFKLKKKNENYYIILYGFMNYTIYQDTIFYLCNIDIITYNLIGGWFVEI